MTRYIIWDKVYTLDEAADFIAEQTIGDCEFDDYVDELYGEIEICGLRYYASQLFKDADPTAYEMALDDYRYYCVDDIISELESLLVFGEVRGIKIEVDDEDDDEDDESEDDDDVVC